MKYEISFTYSTAKVSKSGTISGNQGNGTFDIDTPDTLDEVQQHTEDLKVIAYEALKFHKVKGNIISINITEVRELIEQELHS